MGPRAPVDPEALRPVLAPPGKSVTLPGEAYTSRDVFDWELARLWEGSWVCVCRSTELTGPGDQRAARVGSETILLTRDAEGTLRGFFNVCRHRGHELLAVGSSASNRIVKCPYHGWVYGLDGRLRGAPGLRGLDRPAHGLMPVRVTEWRGWVFANASGDAPSLSDNVGNLDQAIRHHEPERLVVAAQVDYEVRANWKLVHENYQECYHCSSIHPELCAVTPPDSGTPYDPTGVWVGGTMELRPHAATMSLTGRSGARPLRGLDEHGGRQVLYFGLVPNLLISLHPDYVLTHRLTPMAPDRTAVECCWLFAPEDAGHDGFDPAFAVEFWDLTNKQDWRAIESVQRGMASRGHRPGPLAPGEDAVRQFEVIVATAYLMGSLRAPARMSSLVGTDR
jgi:Rieske 2Fe-2S family protein